MIFDPVHNISKRKFRDGVDIHDLSVHRPYAFPLQCACNGWDV